ncbi:DUF4328 domain-containing protein [Streptomyces sp. A5-4]|uniref:DUF4328 domain-containing protein n=1 Tax=Streptomyces sp. A5-4 TaxID=3384771 RepID=UPI003DA9A4D0
MAGLRSPVGLSYAVVALLGAVIAVDLLSIFVSLRVRSLMGDVIVGNFVSDAALEGVDSLTLVATVLFYGSVVASAVVFVVWFFRVRRNAEIFAPDLQRRGAGWAIGAWFVPIGNLWLPRGIATDILAASRRDPYGLGKSKGESGAVLDVWWTMWVASMLFNRWSWTTYRDADTAQELGEAADVAVIGELINITAAVFAILFVRMLTRMQQLKAAPRPAERPVLN